MPIIDSLLDTDLYKLSMAQFVLHQCPGVQVKYKFKCRNEGKNLAEIMSSLQEEVNKLSRLKLTDSEALYLKSLGFFKEDFIQFLKHYRFNSDYVKISTISEEIGISPKELDVVVEGSWLYTILFEVPLLATINELYFKEEALDCQIRDIAVKRLDEKLEAVNRKNIYWADFGTRRRFSRKWHEDIIRFVSSQKNKGFVGTSNVDLARRYDVRPIGTMAHEIFQVCQVLTRPQDSQKYALQHWADEYRGDLGIALTDTLGIEKFLKDFDLYFAKLFDGVRQDSGDPLEWFDKIVNHYESLGIDPKTKTAIFSDGLTFQKMLEISEYVGGRMPVSFGIGTNLTNDVGLEPLNIVMKVVEANGEPVAKISDSLGKLMCEDKDYIRYLKKII